MVDVTGSIPADGTPTTATMTTPGQVAQLSFTGTANQKVSLSLSGGGFTGLGNGIVVSLVDPTGASLGSVTTQSSGYLDTRTLPSNGTYSVVFDPHSYFTGSITARLYTVVDVTGSIMPNGSAVTVTTTVPGQSGRLSFTGAASQEVTVNLTGGNFTGTGNGVVVAIQDSAGTTIGGAITVQTTGTLGPRTLPSAGPYDIVFNPNAAFTGSVTAALTTPGAVLPPSEPAIGVVAARGPPDLNHADAAPVAATSILQKLDADTATSHLAQAPGAQAPTRTPTPTTSDEDEVWTPTDANRRGNWQSERPQPTPFIPLGHDPKPLTSDGIDLTVEGEPITTISLTSPTGQARQNVRGQTVWEGQLLGPQGEVRGRVELTADGRGRAEQTILVGNAYDADDELLATVRVVLEAEDQARLVGGRGLNDTAVSVAYHGQTLRTVTLLVDGTGKPGPQTGPPVRVAPEPRPSPEVRPSPQPPAASPPSRLPGPVRDASPVASPSASPSATATPAATPTLTTPPATGAPAEGAPSLQLDGRQLRLASIELTDAKPRLLPSTTALSGQVLALSGKPLAEVTLAIGGVSTQTDRTGRFLLAPVPDGHQVLTIDGRTANRPDRQFGVFQAGVDLKKGEVNVLSYTIWMPALDTKAAVQIPPVTTRDTVLTTPHIPGLEIHIPAGAQIRDVDGKPATEVGITAIPVDQTPFPIPQFVEVPVYFTVQPGAATIDAPSGAWVVYPNYSDLPPGARADFWQYDPKKRGWFVYGQGTVTVDGKQVVPDPNVRIYDFTGFMFNGHGWAPPSIGAAIDNWTKDGDPVDLETGLFILEKTDLALPDTVPLNLTRTYRPNDSQNRPFGIGSTHPYEIFLWTTMNGIWQDYSQVWLVLPDGARVYYPRISPGTGWTDAVFENTDAPTAYYKSRITYRAGGWDLTFLDGAVYRFGDNAPLQWMRDRYGNITRILRTGVNGQGNGTGPITRVISPNGRWIAFTNGSGNRVSQVSDSLGRTVGYTYDGTGRLTKVTDPAGGETEYTYDASHRMLTIEDARNIVFLTNTYDANGRVATQTQADSTTYQFAYTVNGSTGLVTQTDVTNPRGQVRRVQFNSTRRVTSETFALGTSIAQTVSYTRRTADNFILSVTDPLSRQTTFDYDSFGNVTSVTELAGTGNARTTTATYESKYQQLKTVTDPLNRTATFTYDAKGSLTAVTDPLNRTTSATYDGTGRLLTIKNALNHITQLGYNGPDLVSVTDPLNRTAKLWMDNAGRVLLAIDPLGNRLRLEYDVLNQIKKVIDPFGGQTAFTYDANGNLLTVTDARNGVTQYAYNNMDRLTTVTDPLNRSASAVYDANGNVTSSTDRKSQTTTVTYDALDRPTLVTFADSSTVTPTYDSIGRVTQLADSANGTLTYAYDSFDRLTSETSPHGTVSYGYDGVDRQTSMTVTGQTAVTYAYDDADRLTTITQGSSSASLTYDAADRRTTMTLPNGVVVEYAYDNASNLTGLTYKQGSTTLGNLAYTLDVLGRRERVGGTYARTGVPQALTSATYDAANQLTAWGGTSFTYDATGNLTNDGGSSYTWNARGELTSMSGGTSAAFQYDALGRRRSKTFGGTTTGYLYDGAAIVQELVGGSPSANLLHGPGVDELLTRTDSAGARHLMSDGLGSALGLLDPSATPTTSYTYEPFGRTTSTGSASLNSARFTGREDDGAGLYYYRARYYHPQLQRFISEDPIGFAGGDANLHAYVGNDPVNATDPSGNIAALPLAAACGLGGATGALTFGLLNGRKTTLGGAAGAALTGCVAGLAGLGIGRLAFSVLPQIMPLAGAGAAACGVNSFSAETDVATESGPRRIDSIRVGDRVLAYDEETGETSYQLVTATWGHQDPIVVHVTVGAERLVATPDHPFSVVGRGWVEASDLRPGDRIHRAFGGTGPVTNVTVTRQPQVMYNLTVDAAHTFFVGDDEWLVHNTSRGAPGGFLNDLTYVYRVIQNGVVVYVGITNNLRVRAGQHTQRGFAIQRIAGLPPLPRDLARNVEQALIERHGLQSNGGTLHNTVNSIPRSNPDFSRRVIQGLNFLRGCGYR